MVAADRRRGGGRARVAFGVAVPAVRVSAVDTTSAGDLFHAGCLYGLLQRWSVEESLHFAAAAAALACRVLGGRTSVPALADVHELLKADPWNPWNP